MTLSPSLLTEDGHIPRPRVKPQSTLFAQTSSKKPLILLESMACLSASGQEKGIGGVTGRGGIVRRGRGASNDPVTTTARSSSFEFLLASHAVPYRRRRQEPQERYGLPHRLTEAVTHDLDTPQGVLPDPGYARRAGRSAAHPPHARSDARPVRFHRDI